LHPLSDKLLLSGIGGAMKFDWICYEGITLAKYFINDAAEAPNICRFPEHFLVPLRSNI
jgi:hypothetical protein